MMAQPFRDECNNSRLRSFLDDDLPEPDNVQLADHLTHCEVCRRTLERLAAGSRLWAELRQAIPAPGPVLAHPVSEPHGTLPHGDPPPEGDVALDFLEPSGSEGSLGRLGPYEVTGVLGRGGFGIVLKACDPALNRTVAIKILAPQLAISGVARSRFAREARAAAAVVHDNVVAIHAVDILNGLPYLVMPFIAGQSLQQRVDRDGPLAIKEVLRIGMQAALGLAAAHGQGLVHRDIKPSNILLENGLERVKLCDFGMARAVDDASLTQSGVVSGTPQYMSPEQARGEAVDHRSDLFGLGGVLYFMCAGHPPFRADSTPAVLRRVCDDQPRPLREINSDVPEWLAEIIERLHAKEPSGRYETATEVAEVLQHHLSELQRLGTSAPPVPQVPVRKRSVRKPIAAILLTSAVVIAAITGGYSLIPSGEQFSRSAGDDPAKAQIVGSGKAPSKSWDKKWSVPPFDEIFVSGNFKVVVTRGPTRRVTANGNEGMLRGLRPRVEKILKHDRLILDLNNPADRTKAGSDAIEVRITVPDLSWVLAEGRAVVTIIALENETLRLTGSDTAKIEASGRCSKLFAHIRDRSQLDASRLVCSDVSAIASGKSSSVFNATKSLKVVSSDDSRVEYLGSPQLYTTILSERSTILKR